MSSGDPSLTTVQQLSRQLHVVSEIAESLTIRLLSLEERIQQLEVEAEQPSANDEENQQLLAQSSDRLRHLHGLLSDESSEPDLRLVEASEELVDETVYVDDPQTGHVNEEESVDDSDLDHVEEEQIDLISA